MDTSDWNYLLCTCGGGALFFLAWWIFCFTVRSGIDGLKALAKAVNEKRWPSVRRILIGDWK